MNGELRAELLAMRAEDQDVAEECWRASEADDRFRGLFLFQVEVERSEWPEVFREAELVTERHSVRLGQIVGAHGWPGRSLVGPDGAEASWLILQHSGSELQGRCLPLLRAALDQGDVLPQQCASVADRLELVAGRAQRYGTHLSLDGQNRHVPTGGVADPERLDRIRAEIGLDPWETYVEGLGGRPGPIGAGS